jgi:hypothetical protein
MLESIASQLIKLLTCPTQIGRLASSYMAQLRRGEGASVPEECISVNEWERCIFFAHFEDGVEFQWHE